MNYEAIKSIKFVNGKLLAETSEAITTPNNNLVEKALKWRTLSAVIAEIY